MSTSEQIDHRALVIDDSSAMRMILSRIMKGLGFEVHQACNGVEALSRLDEVAGIRVALVDWNMPEMDGVEFVRTVRARGDRQLKVLMVTSESDVARMQSALEAGADEYAMKPFDAGIIRDKLELLGLVGT
ncbi:response regulator [Actinomarinicola tropica]|uniref:Response regulator n=1 Tax=Actinomarinicola tropica TaxID=2789776 RepID=A0A5Q2RD27_9ACTN|nr:response regulator [Actinomarinicola tropica]QGG94758.1 response regulator [Actinomarinicola tropica]